MVRDIHTAGKCAVGNDEHQTRVLAERVEIERKVSGRTLCDLLEDNARRYPGAPAVSWRQGEEWATLTWRELRAGGGDGGRAGQPRRGAR